MKTNGNKFASTAAPASLPISSHTPAPYDGPSRDEVLAMRRQYLTPGLITYYREPLLIAEGPHAVRLGRDRQAIPRRLRRDRHRLGRPLSSQDRREGPRAGRPAPAHDDDLSPSRGRPARQEAGRAHARRPAACRSAISRIPAARPTRSPCCRRASSPAIPTSSACATATTAARRRPWR